MSIKLELEGRVIKDAKHYTLVNYTLLTRNNLPKDYLEGYPHAYAASEQDMVVRINPTTSVYYQLGEVYTKPAIDNLITVLGMAGNRLRVINDRLRRENAGWEGKMIIMYV